MIELNKTQKSVLKVLKDTYKKDTVTRAEINALVKKKVIKNPSWLKSDKYKVDRGVYTLNVDSVESDTTKTTTDTKVSNQVFESNATDKRSLKKMFMSGMKKRINSRVLLQNFIKRIA